MSSADVSDYIDGLAPEKRARMSEVREWIRAAAPDAEEVITYKMPGFKLDGRFFVSYDAYKNHLSLFPASDGVIAALGADAPRYVRSRGTLQFSYDDPPTEDLVRRVVEARLAEVKSGRR